MTCGYIGQDRKGRYTVLKNNAVYFKTANYANYYFNVGMKKQNYLNVYKKNLGTF